MKTIRVIIERSVDHFSAYAENCDGIYGGGDTAEEAKANALEGLRLLIETCPADRLPDILKGEYEIVFKYDIRSLLNYYNKYFSNVALESLTGINQKQLFHYASGLKKPRETQRKKIEEAFHKLGKELLAVEL
ncbi:antitoxin HicB [Bacteroides sp. OttesenSCG-928-D19]|nr:antitoxin HicB [Bacteroides sp. OttesenSCG-928-D19]